GCFESTYPNRQWREVPCTTTPKYPQQRERGAQRATGAGQSGTAQLSSDELKRREDWGMFIAQLPLPRKGCFQSAYPNTRWREAACTTTPSYPQALKHGPRPLTVGNGNAVSAWAPSGNISTAIGSFDSVNVTSESGKIGNTGPDVANAYTLQLNTGLFPTPACDTAADPTVCQGWQQF